MEVLGLGRKSRHLRRVARPSLVQLGTYKCACIPPFNLSPTLYATHLAVERRCTEFPLAPFTPLCFWRKLSDLPRFRRLAYPIGRVPSSDMSHCPSRCLIASRHHHTFDTLPLPPYSRCVSNCVSLHRSYRSFKEILG